LGPPDVYGTDRLFVSLGEEKLHEAVRPLEDAGHHVIHLVLDDSLELGREFFRWEFATAVAGHVLGIQPFDQPNVQEAKDATKRLLAAGDVTPPSYDAPRVVLEEVKPGDYIAIQAFVPRNDHNEARLHAIRMRLR